MAAYYFLFVQYPGVSEIDSHKPPSRYKSGLGERIGDLPSNEPDAWQNRSPSATSL
jgi:hypothetical protein